MKPNIIHSIGNTENQNNNSMMQNYQIKY